MIEIILYILFPTIVALLVLGLSKTSPGSDHFFHLNTIQKIKRTNHRFISGYLFSVNEKHPFYPQLYHWILSFLPEKIYSEKYKYLEIIIKAIEIIAFNLFLGYLYRTIGFNKITFLYANIVFNSFPFSYAFWNAKNTGLSARGIGLVVGQVYLYLIIIFIISGSLWLLLPIFIVVFIILLLSQMATQLVILSLPFIVIIFKVPELLLLPFLSYLLFYLLMPKIAKNYIIGQFNHKRNYALFLAKIFILNKRPSIYRDFVYDFWIRHKRGFLGSIYYFYTNPIIEVLYGFPYLWFITYDWYVGNHSDELVVLYKIVAISVGVFIVTSFRFTRFLGEPQRYIEFVLPVITFIFVVTSPPIIIFISTLISIAFVITGTLIMRRLVKSHNPLNNKKELIEYLEILPEKKCTICISNDNDLLKELPALGVEVVLLLYLVI